VLRRLQPHWVSVDNSIDVFPEIEPDRVLLSPTRGDARGVELLVTRSPGHRVTWSASYALAKTTDVVNGRTVPRTLDQRHTIALDAGWRPSPGWQFSAAWLYHTGWPTTPFTFVVDTLADGRFLVNRLYAARNTDRSRLSSAGFAGHARRARPRLASRCSSICSTSMIGTTARVRRGDQRWPRARPL
jgi:hypothetical protein